MRYLHSGDSLEEEPKVLVSNGDSPGKSSNEVINGSEQDLDESDATLPPWTSAPTGEIPISFDFTREPRTVLDLDKVDIGAVAWVRDARGLECPQTQQEFFETKKQMRSNSYINGTEANEKYNKFSETDSFLAVSPGRSEHSQFEPHQPRLKLSTEPVRRVSSRTNPMRLIGSKDKKTRPPKVSSIASDDGYPPVQEEQLSYDEKKGRTPKTAGRGGRHFTVDAKKAATSPSNADETPVMAKRLSPPRKKSKSHTRTGGNVEKSASPSSSTIYRLVTGLLLGTVTLSAVGLGQVAFMPYLTIVILAATVEFYALISKESDGSTKIDAHPVRIIGLIGTVAVILGAYEKGAAAITFALSMTVLMAMVWYLTGKTKSASLSNVVMTVLPVLWIGGGGAFAALIVRPIVGDPRRGIAFMLAIIMTTVAADVFAYVGGSLLGRTKLAPAISPGKTLEGLLIGAIGAILTGSLIASHIHPITVSIGGALGVISAIAGPCGDLVESKIKRELGAKDSGRLLPGHGGVLDRIDALIFVTPFAYYFLYFGHHI